ncbi:hypothetical protein BIY29_17665 [Brenneria alni]|uniref:Uncharacterized protein n=1 Tax=Brenneria alni TaxID=71656 RepID=A0A421DJJ2_9GAMM|nr:antirestriction protein [Brenneria alni]RLM18816.1 hypothetical protein BIY29_17665 [Brenneria alni]
MTQTNKASAFEVFYSFMTKETYNVFVQYIIGVWESKCQFTGGSWNDWHPQVTGDLETPVYAVPDGDKVYNVRASRFQIQVTTDAFGLLVTLCALHGLLLDIKDDRLPASDFETLQTQKAFDRLLRYARSHKEANAITPEFGLDNSSYRDLATESVDDLLHQRSVFANAIGEGAVRLGIIAEGTPLTMPQLLMVLGDIIGYASRTLSHKTALSLSVNELTQSWIKKTGSSGIFVPVSYEDRLDGRQMVLDMKAIRASDDQLYDEISTSVLANSTVGREELTGCDLIILKADSYGDLPQE